MNENFIALLENSAFFKANKPNLKLIESASVDQILEFCNELSEITSIKNFNKQNSLYTHSASIGLGGGRQPCCAVNCRLKRTQELAQFASLYSDRVYINNFAHEHVLHSEHLADNQDKFRKEFAHDIIIYSYLLPLIDKGFVVPVSHMNMCPHCLTTSCHDQSALKYDQLQEFLNNKFYNEVEFSLSCNHDGGYFFNAKGTEKLLSHGNQSVWLDDITNLKELIPSISEKLSIEKDVIFTTEEAQRIFAAELFTDGIMQTISFELSGAAALKTAYLSDSDFDIELLQKMTDDPVTKKCTSLMGNHLKCLVPFLGNVTPAELLELRKNEEESFVLFRNSLSKAVEEYRENGQTFTDRDAQILYSDVVMPNLAALEAKVKKAKRHFMKGSRRKIMGWVGALSAGFYIGSFTADPVAGGVTFGAVKAASELIDNVMTQSDSEESIKDDELYFLWKVKKLSK